MLAGYDENNDDYLVKKQQPHNIGCCFFNVCDFPKAEFEGYCRVELIYILH